MPRLRYVVVLRVRLLTSLIFKKPFDFSLFSTIIRPTRLVQIANTIRCDFEQIRPKLSNKDT